MSDVSFLPEKSALSLGLRLATRREEKGIPLEQAAHETRMKVQRLREMEADDLSHFVHPSYARMFLMDYARYLGLPLDEIRPMLPASGTCGGEGYQYLQTEGPLPIRRVSPMRRLRRMSPAVSSIAVGALALLLIAGGIRTTIVLRDINRLGLDKVSDKSLINSSHSASEPKVVEPTAPISPVESSMIVPPMPDSNASAALFVGGAVDHGNAVQ